jgi:hypothetical protein
MKGMLQAGQPVRSQDMAAAVTQMATCPHRVVLGGCNRIMQAGKHQPADTDETVKML